MAYASVLLAFVAGSVDGLGYLLLFQLFTSHMTGNSVVLGTELGQLHWAAAVRAAFPIPLFVLGVAVGATVREAASRKGLFPRPVVMALEALLLVAFLFVGSALSHSDRVRAETWHFYAMAILATLAMGLQNSVPPRVEGQSVRTTYISGTLTNLAETLVAWLLRREGRPEASLFRAVFFGGVWAAYVLGAIVSGYTQQRWGAAATVFPIAALTLVIAHDLIRPSASATGRDAKVDRAGRARSTD